MNIGITLMIVGMVTVFAVLLIIIYLSNGLIALVNHIAPEEKKARGAEQVPGYVMAVISHTVAQITGGRGTVKKVQAL